MGLLDNDNKSNTFEAEKNNYQFASGGIDEFIEDYNRPKQEQPIDEIEGLDQLNEMIESEEPPLEKIRARSSVANATGSLLATAIDSGLSTLLGSLIAKDNPSNFKCDEEQKEELVGAISEYVKLKGGDIPPGLALIIVVISIYAPKAAFAFQVRKFNQKEAEYQSEIETLKSELEKLKESKND